MQRWRVAGISCDDLKLLGVLIDAKADALVPQSDCFTRDGDLVTTFDPTEARPARVQIYWRWGQAPCVPEAALAVIDLQVSTQTDLLDSWPALATRSVIASNTVEQLTATGQWQRWTTGIPLTAMPVAFEIEAGQTKLRYVEMLHPDDAREFADPTSCCTLGTGGWVLQHRLFGERLEKGVIRRARVRGLFLPANLDARVVLSAYQAWADFAPPLTA
ncbi:MAG: hypothetical protein K1X74_18650 [Pirellulales bacterium]|nr:hypothetical protein [Pirellulales bacterium]